MAKTQHYGIKFPIQIVSEEGKCLDLVRLYQTDKMNIGDYFVFCNIGAYSVTEGIYLFLSRTLPKIIVYENTEQYIVRRDFIETSGLNTPIQKM